MLAFCFWLVAPLACAQAPETATAGDAQQPDEYSEYESIPPPQIELRTDVVSDTPEAPESSASEEAAPAEDSPSAAEVSPDPIMEDLNRELDLRAGRTTVPPEDASATGRSGSTAYNLVKAFAWLLVVIAIILLVYYFLQRRSSGGKLLTGPRLGTVLGRIYLNPRMCLHFVRTGGKVLVVGQTQNALSLIAEFREDEFAVAREEKPEEQTEHVSPGRTRDFFSQLRANLTQMSGEDREDTQESQTSVEEDDIAALRGDIHRLQEYLRDSTREPER